MDKPDGQGKVVGVGDGRLGGLPPGHLTPSGQGGEETPAGVGDGGGVGPALGQALSLKRAEDWEPRVG